MRTLVNDEEFFNGVDSEDLFRCALVLLEMDEKTGFP
jgi:hypothetical protein